MTSYILNLKRAIKSAAQTSWGAPCPPAPHIDWMVCVRYPMRRGHLFKEPRTDITRSREMRGDQTLLPKRTISCVRSATKRKASYCFAIQRTDSCVRSAIDRTASIVSVERASKRKASCVRSAIGRTASYACFAIERTDSNVSITKVSRGQIEKAATGFDLEVASGRTASYISTASYWNVGIPTKNDGKEQ